ncbi:MAG: hypothetical protein MZV70_43325 [Desulfobacterales bacterium]|nr:hypothetical protein [Desulfobacterales bacterium]
MAQSLERGSPSPAGAVYETFGEKEGLHHVNPGCPLLVERGGDCADPHGTSVVLPDYRGIFCQAGPSPASSTPFRSIASRLVISSTRLLQETWAPVAYPSEKPVGDPGGSARPHRDGSRCLGSRKYATKANSGPLGDRPSSSTP